MIIRLFSTVAFVALLGLAAGAAPKHSMKYLPVECLKGGEMPLFQVAVTGDGELRAYFRRLNSTDWCSIEGVNDGPFARVVLPKFEPGDEIEYFFVLLDGRRVVARSPRIYRASVRAECEVPFARHVERLSVACGEDMQSIPNAIVASTSVDNPPEPPYGSPDRPQD